MRVIVPVWLMIVEKNIDQGSALLAKWFITAELPEKKSEPLFTDGSFQFSLAELLPATKVKPLMPNDYCCYLVINGNVFGPEKFSICK
jgi:hypothetical protein